MENLVSLENSPDNLIAVPKQVCLCSQIRKGTLLRKGQGMKSQLEPCDIFCSELGSKE